MKVAIVGGRDFNNFTLLKLSVENIIKGSDITEIISGAAKGADTLAAHYARDNKIQLREFIADWKRFGKSAGYKRNKLIVQECDILIAFWDGESSGTKHSIGLAKDLNKKTYIIEYKND